jgi:hypothetical protein
MQGRHALARRKLLLVDREGTADVLALDLPGEASAHSVKLFAFSPSNFAKTATKWDLTEPLALGALV